MSQPKEYYAFISYKREDERWAKWLQRKLENYRLPSVVREQRPDAPKYLRPVFRDGTDLSGSVLADSLRHELLQSRFLIVICSPNATKSDWVNKEIQTFINDGHLEQIIPFIVEGTPHCTNPAEECLPKVLRDIPTEKELLGINVKEGGRNVAFIRLVATMLGVRFDTLWQRHRRKLIRRRIVYGCATALLFAIGFFAWDYTRAKYEYYADYVDCYGKPVGVVQLTKEQVSHRHRSYLFENRRTPLNENNALTWRVVKVSHINSDGIPQEITNTEWKDRYPIQKIEYNNDNGHVYRINYCDSKENILLRHTLLSDEAGTPACIADFVDSQLDRGPAPVGDKLSSMLMGEMDSLQRKSNIIRYVYKRDQYGHIISQTYQSNNVSKGPDTAVPDADGIYGRRFCLDSLGRRIKVEYLGKIGDSICVKTGVAGRVYEYDDFGNISAITYINENGERTMNELWHAICIGTSDEYGNIVREDFFDEDSIPCMIKTGFAIRAAKCDSKGNGVELTYYDTEGQPCLCSDGYFKMTVQYDKHGNVIDKAFFDTNNKRI